MKNFKEITKNINSDLDFFERMLIDIADDQKEVIKDILDYIFESKGKRIRPVLVYLTARLFAEPNSTTHNAALLVELMHTASLLHDDVVDKAKLRRGNDTVNFKWDDKTAILAGDFLFAKAMKIATDNNEYRLFDIITPAIISLSVGELQQMANSAKFEVSEEKYLEVIRDKTASLLSVCCKSGVYSAGVSDDLIEKAGKFGEIIGLIFQIKDDILDYIGNGETGKQIGIDIKEGKITLPFIYAWNAGTKEEKETLKLYWNNPQSQESVNSIISEVVRLEGVKNCENTMKSLKSEALLVLNDFPKTKAREALAAIIDYIIDRDK
jgi:octaprenyl-diphosphate synthase